MKKICLLLVTSILCLSCKTGKNIDNKSTLGSIGDAKDIAYFSPVYSFETEESAKSRKGRFLVKYTNHAADSIFQAESEIFRIRKKIIPNDPEVSLKIMYHLDSIFTQVLEKQSIENLKIPPIIDLVTKENSTRYSLAMLVRPVMNRRNSKFRSIEYHLLIFDSVSRQIAFYGKSSQKKQGYGKSFIHNMKEIYGIND